MANILTTQVLKDGTKETIIKVTILGDGSGEETATVIFDASAYTPAVIDNNLREVEYALNGFDAQLLWDATANVPIIALVEDHQSNVNYHSACGLGGLPNNASTGKTGDILMTTLGLGAGDFGHIILRVKKNIS